MVIGAPLIVSPAACQRTRRRQDFSRSCDKGRDDTGPPPQAFSHIEVRHHSDASQEVSHHFGSRPADEPVRPGNFGIVGRRLASMAV